MYRLLNELSLLVYHHECLLCEKITSKERICRDCKGKLKIPPTPFQCPRCYSPQLTSDLCRQCMRGNSPFASIASLWTYQDEARTLIHSLKYKKQHQLCSELAQHIHDGLRSFFPSHEWDLIIPIPQSWPRLRTRGYNQCAIIADILTRELYGRRLHHREQTTLRTTKDRPPQSTLTTKQRIKNVREAFTVRGEISPDLQILLIDDVLTTGATATTAGRALRDAGAEHIDLFTLTRSEHWPRYRRLSER